MVVRLATDNQNNFAGYSADFSFGSVTNSVTYICISSSTTVSFPSSATSGTMKSNADSELYSSNFICVFQVSAPLGRSVVLNFTRFQTELNSDWVQVYDGQSSGYPLMMRASGATIPPIQTTSQQNMIVRFATDNINNYAGFSADFHFGDLPNNITYICSSSNNVVFPATAITGTLKSNADSELYSSNQICSFTISAPYGQVVVLNFTRFATQLNVDLVQVYDGITNSYPLMLAASGTDLPPIQTSTQQNMFVRFTTDGQNNYAGYSADYHFGNVPNRVTYLCQNSVTITFPAVATTGTLKTNPDSALYINNAICTWIISAPTGHKVVLNFTRFQTEPSADYVGVYDGTYLSSPLLIQASGSSTPPLVTTTQQNMYVRFTSNSQNDYAGFSADYYFV